MFSEYASKFLTTSQARTGNHDRRTSPNTLTPPTQRSQSQLSIAATASRLFFSAAESLSPDADNVSRSVSRTGPRRTRGLVTNNSRVYRGRTDLREYEEDDDDDDDDGEDDDDDAVTMGHSNNQALMPDVVPASSRVFPARTSRFFFKTPPASHGQPAESNARYPYGADSRTYNDAFEGMQGTYTGQLYGADSAIRSSWKAYDEKEEARISRSHAVSAGQHASSSELASSRNSLESVGLESVISRGNRQQSPPPARLRFNEHPFPRNMRAATMNAANIRQHAFLDDFEDEELEEEQEQVQEMGHVGLSQTEFNDRPPENIEIEIPSVPMHNLKSVPEDIHIFHDQDEIRPAASFMPRVVASQTDRVISNGFIPPLLANVPASASSMDRIWSNLYIVSMCALFATSFIVWLETEVTGPISLADSIYTVIGGSLSVLVLDTFLAVVISILWFVLLRNCIRPLFYLLVIAIPLVFTGLTMFTLIMSYRDSWGGNTTQDRAMRWSTLIPIGLAIFWTWFVIKGRKTLGRAIGIVQLACKILAENQSLVLLSMGTLLASIAFTWAWVLMFTRIFLRGRTSTTSSGITIWIVEKNSWALGAWYVIMYLWTWGVISGMQRATTSITVSQWYFHRQVVPRPSSSDIVTAAFIQSGSTFYGTVCFSSFVSLLIRLPLIILPRRLVSLAQSFLFSMLAGPVSAITNPLTLSFAAITVRSLMPASRGISSLRFIDLGSHHDSGDSWTAFRLAKMLLSSARVITAIVLGFGAWIHAAQDVNGGSLYGYVVGLLAGAIGWIVLGTTEGNLSMILDASFVCFGIDQVGNRGGHCVEADAQFGGITSL
ncbi:hypothetical protein V1514DRAFT_339170 [Lipomyces japonicus]|uniref:uncharacterized protein n=1 Tax=Lipomyces japonicus TaxID=56871 RepID=UPI0034CE1E3C